jgi:hypothetical protein
MPYQNCFGAIRPLRLAWFNNAAHVTADAEDPRLGVFASSCPGSGRGKRTAYRAVDRQDAEILKLLYFADYPKAIPSMAIPDFDLLSHAYPDYWKYPQPEAVRKMTGGGRMTLISLTRAPFA